MSEPTDSEVREGLSDGNGESIHPVSQQLNEGPDAQSPPELAATMTYQRGGSQTGTVVANDTSTARDERRRPPSLPKRVGDYEILGLLGRGGMGVVYKARQPGLHRVVALKMILAADHARPEEIARFRSEAETVARLQHPNIVQIYEIGDDGDRPFFSLEFVEGTSLSQKLAGKPQQPRDAAEIMHVLAKAMAAAHARGIIHRDLKPANVLVNKEGQLKISDFGLAKRIEGDEGGLTQSGLILGTPHYMAPEQAAGLIRDIGPAADIYALGVMLYEMLVGRVPLRGASVLDTLQQVINKEPLPPSQLEPRLPRDLETICLKCLRKDPGKRYPRVDDLAEDLRRFLAGEPILARPVSSAERAWRWCKRNPRVAALSGAVAALVLIWAATASAMAWWLKVEKDATAAAKQLADRNADVANANAETAKNNERVAIVQGNEAKHQAKIAKAFATQAEKNATQADKNAKAARKLNELSFEILREVGEAVRVSVLEKRGGNDPAAARAVQLEIQDVIVKKMDRLSTVLTNEGVPNFANAAAKNEIGELMFRFGHAREALEQFETGYHLAREALEKDPGDEFGRGNAALLLMQMGKMHLEIDDDAEAARDCFVKAHALQQSLADEHREKSQYSAGDHWRLLSFYEVQTGIADLHLGRPAEALQSFNAALAHRESWVVAEPNNVSARSYLAEVQWYLGIVRWHLNDMEAAQVHYNHALNVCRDLAGKLPNDFSFQLDLAEILGDYCEAKLRMNKPNARQVIAMSLDSLKAVLAHDPEFVSRQALLARTYERQALVALKEGQPDEARQRFDDARKLRTDLMLVEPQNESWKMALAVTLAHCGELTAAAQRAQDVVDKSPENIGLLLQAARTWAVCGDGAANDDEKTAYRNRAFDALGKATAGKFRDPVFLETDPELALLAGDERFAALLAEIKRDDR